MKRLVTGCAAALVLALASCSSGTPTPTPLPRVTTPPQFIKLDTVLAYRPNAMPVIERSNGKIFAPDAVNAIMDSYRKVWREGFASMGLKRPELVYILTANGDSFRSNCTDAGGEPIVVQPNLTYMLYCRADAPPDGAIVVPVNSLARLWTNGNTVQADLSVAISVSRQAALITTEAIGRQVGATPPKGIELLRLAACLGGTWMHAVYKGDIMLDEQITKAAELSFESPTFIDGEILDTKHDDQMVQAWWLGFGAGEPQICALNYWQV